MYRHIVTIEILSEDAHLSGDLADIAYQIDEGSDVGGPVRVHTMEINGKEMVESLYRIGSDPSFFELDENGQFTE